MLLDRCRRQAQNQPRRVVFPDAKDARVIEAAHYLQHHGLAQPIILANPFALRHFALAAGLPLERSERRGLPLMRQVQLIIGLCVLTGSILALAVHPNFALIPAFFGAGLTMAGSTGWCGLAILLSKMPWNRVQCAGGGVKSCSI